MTTAADDSAVEDAFEALLAGRPAPQGTAGLAAFTEAVRNSATSPGRPNAALAELLATGLLVDQSSPSARTARSAGAPPSRASRNRIRRRFAVFFPALLAKLLSAGAVAQAATGATVVVVAFTGAGAVGVLPGPVQDTFTTIVSDETEQLPVEELPTEELPVEELPAEEVPVAEAPVAEAPVVEEEPVTEVPLDDPWSTPEEWATNGPIDGHPFGEWVSFGRSQGWGNGALVSCWAHHRNDELAPGEVSECAPAVAPVEDGSEVEAPAVDDTEDGAVETEAEDGDRRGNGNGRGHGNGRGNGNGRN